MHLYGMILMIKGFFLDDDDVHNVIYPSLLILAAWTFKLSRRCSMAATSILKMIRNFL